MQYKSLRCARFLLAGIGFASVISCGGHREETRKKILGNPTDTSKESQRNGETDLGETKDQPKLPTTPKHDDPKNPVTVDFSAPSLEGKWKANCVSSAKNSSDPAQNTQKEQVLFAGDQVVFATDLYLKADCTSFTHSVLVSSSFQVHASTDAGKTYPAEFVLVKIELIPRTQEEAENLNDLEGYGLTNWKKDVANDITGKKRFPDEKALPESGRTLFDIFSLIDNKLAFGLASSAFGTQPTDLVEDGSTAEKRPKQVNIVAQFQKQ